MTGADVSPRQTRFPKLRASPSRRIQGARACDGAVKRESSSLPELEGILQRYAETDRPRAGCPWSESRPKRVGIIATNQETDKEKAITGNSPAAVNGHRHLSSISKLGARHQAPQWGFTSNFRGMLGVQFYLPLFVLERR